jgi:purine-binding chemotaxis protein CheW
LPERDIRPDDALLLAHTKRRAVVLPIDACDRIVEAADDDVVPSEDIAPGLEHLPGVVKLDDGLVLIHDLERFLSSDEGNALDVAMAPGAGS